MAGPSYRLQAPRPRQAPPPLTFDNSKFRPASTISTNRDSITLLYDLPSSVASPPISPKSPRTPTSPTSARHSQLIKSGRPTPPPNARNRSQAPIALRDLEKFAELCTAWFYKQDERAGQQVAQTLSSLPPYHQAPFARVQSSIREAYHRSVAARRHAELQAHLSFIQPGASLSAHLRPNPRSKDAQKERYDHMQRFIDSWCTTGIPGTKPFFEALWAVLRLQVIPDTLGGAGRNRIEWEFDDAVLKESAGKDFMLEAIELLKGVLAFEEQPSSKHFGTTYGSTPPPLYPDAQSQPPISSESPPLSDSGKQVRAPHDPFSDTPPPLPLRSVGAASLAIRAVKLSAEPLTPTTATGYDISKVLPNNGGEQDMEEEYMRIWTSPDLSNPDVLQLLGLFPPFVSRRILSRFHGPAARPADIEGGEDASSRTRVRYGTGSMWISSKQRSDGWDGSWWTNFVHWWKRMFC